MKESDRKDFEALMQRMLEGELIDTERDQLQKLLMDHPELRETLMNQCQLHAQLTMDGALQQLLADGSLIDEEIEDALVAESQTKKRGSWKYVFVPIAAAVILASILQYVNTTDSKTQSQTTVQGGLAMNESRELSPQESYSQAKFTDSGSQQRPPTSFANASANMDAGLISFNKDIRPLLSENCYNCHGPDEHTREAELRLDLEEFAFANREVGGPAIIPGDAANSPVYQRIISDLKSEVMPPPNSHKSLNAVEIDIIRQWIDEGAQWEQHWAFMKPERHAEPDVEWGNNGIDKFTYAEMQKQGLEPNPEADRATLARRLSLDLLGLPPTYSEVQAFINDESPNAYERYVDLLMSKVKYGEHQARFWLDYVRYADTHGLHFDNYREIWPYRDWVVDAFNNNKPYDTFILEQLAGDLLPNPTKDQLIATGYNRSNLTSNEGGSIADELQVRYVEDRVGTTSTVMLGLTMQCASCHDHKFDPISQKDFYQFAAFFNNLESSVWDRNVRDHKPVVVIPPEDLADQLNEVEPKLEEYAKRFKAIRDANPNAFVDWYQNPESTIKTTHYEDNIVLSLVEPEKAEESESTTEEVVNPLYEPIILDGAADILDFDKDFTLYVATRFQDFKTPVIPLLDNFDGDRGIRMQLVLGYYNDAPYYTLQFEMIHSLKDGNLISVTSSPREIMEANRAMQFVVTYDGSSQASGIRFLKRRDGWSQANASLPIDRDETIDNLSGSFHVDQPFMSGVDEEGVKLAKNNIRKIMILDRHLYPFELTLTREDWYRGRLNGIREGKLSTLQQEFFENYYFEQIHPEYNTLMYEQAAMQAVFADIYAVSHVSLISKEQDGEPHAFILDRGEYDKRLDRVTANVPSALGSLGEDVPKNRLGLAKWIIDPNNPLTARVTVNRFWQNFFGTGLVKTAEDFGIMGENPTHPELLDHLAIHFVESGWDVKATIKYILMSATYRQSSKAGPEKWDRDRENTFLARGPRFRLDAEVIRDQALYASGLLVEEVGGPPVKPYQPKGIWHAVGYTSSNTANYSQDEGEALYRRSLYTFWKRTAPPPNMVVFDAPSRENCTVRRERTNTPMQALTLMNDPQYIEAARKLAYQSLNLEAEQEAERIEYMYKRVFGVDPSEQFTEVMLDSFQAFYAEFRENPESASSLLEVGDLELAGIDNNAQKAAMTLVANQIMNLDTFVTKF